MSGLDPAAYPRTWAVLSAALGAHAERAAWPAHVWQRAWALGVGPTLVGFARGRGVEVPGEIGRLVLASAAAGVARRHQMRAVLAAMGEIGCLIHKGDPLGQGLYGDVRWRASGDVDLLIELCAVEAAAQALRGLGYAPLYGMERPEPLLVDEWGWRHEGTGQVVELHWSLAAPHIPSPSWARLWAGRREVLVSGGRCMIMGEADELLGLCYHFHHHVGHLKGLVDVASWLDQRGRGAAYGEALGVAREIGAEGVVRWPEDAIGCLEGRSYGGVLSRWTAGVVRGAFERDGAGAGFKVTGLSQAQIACWQAAGGLALDGWERRFGAVLYPFFYSPQVWAWRRGSEAVGWRDRATWVMRPGVMMVKQLKNVIFGSAGA